MSDKELLNQYLQSVQPLQVEPRVPLMKPKPLPEPVQTLRDQENALRESLSDDFDVDSLLETDESLSYRAQGVDASVVQKLRRGQWVIQSQIDLHGLRSEEAREALSLYLRKAQAQGLRCLRVIHGKGLGSVSKVPVLKAKVLRWLVQKQEVMAFVQAKAADGGSGALIVLLRNSTSKN